MRKATSRGGRRASPVTRTKGIEAGALLNTREVAEELPGIGEERVIASADQADGPAFKDYAAALAFMEDPVTIMIETPRDQSEENPVQVGCNGIRQFIVRGQPQTIKRKYLESLLRSKPISVRTEVDQPTAGQDPKNRVIKMTGLKYPVTVIEDRNPNGRAWLQKVMAEG